MTRDFGYALHRCGGEPGQAVQQDANGIIIGIVQVFVQRGLAVAPAAGPGAYVVRQPQRIGPHIHRGNYYQTAVSAEGQGLGVVPTWGYSLAARNCSAPTV